MKRRMTETGKWQDKWFRALPFDLKLTYLYIVDNCDNVGVWEPDEELVRFMTKLPDQATGLPFEEGNSLLDRMYDALGKDRVMRTGKGYWWLTKFCDFQYGPLDPGSTSKPIQSYIALLQKHNLWEPYCKGSGIGIGKRKDMDNEIIEEGEVVAVKAGLTIRVNKFIDEVMDIGLKKYGEAMCKEFITYWTECNRSGTKMRCELQPTWETSRRLATWKKNDYGGKKMPRNDDKYL